MELVYIKPLRNAVVWMQTVIVILCLTWVWVGEVGAQFPTAGNYYSTPGGNSSTCLVTPCPFSSCPTGQYLKDCTFNSSGACAPCTNVPAAGRYLSSFGAASGICPTLACNNSIPAGQFYSGPSATAGVATCPLGACSNPIPAGQYYSGPGATAGTATCPLGACLNVIPAGQYYSGPGATAGVATCPLGACTNPIPSGQFYSGPGTTPGTATCPLGACTNAVPGQFYSGPGSIPGTATCPVTNCTDSGCAIGQFAQGCAGTSNGTCSPCTNAPPNTVYSGKGSWTGNCAVVGCPNTCGIGQWVSGCGSVVTALSCQSCTNAVDHSTYYVSVGGYNSTSCQVRACPVCSNGFFTLNCRGTSSGTCESCTN